MRLRRRRRPCPVCQTTLTVTTPGGFRVIHATLGQLYLAAKYADQSEATWPVPDGSTLKLTRPVPGYRER